MNAASESRVALVRVVRGGHNFTGHMREGATTLKSRVGLPLRRAGAGWERQNIFGVGSPSSSMSSCVAFEGKPKCASISHFSLRVEHIPICIISLQISIGTFVIEEGTTNELYANRRSRYSRSTKLYTHLLSLTLPRLLAVDTIHGHGSRSVQGTSYSRS